MARRSRSRPAVIRCARSAFSIADGRVVGQGVELAEVLGGEGLRVAELVGDHEADHGPALAPKGDQEAVANPILPSTSC